MKEYGVEELVLLALGAETGADDAVPAAITSELGDAIGLTDTMADRLTLLSAMSSLSEAELVDETVGSVGDRDGERSVYRLTDAGRRRAIELRETLVEERVTVHDCEETVECRLGDVPERFDLSIPEALVRCSPAGDLYLETETDDGIVDRVDELARLEDAFEATRNGEPTTAIVSGDAGIGKTTLVEAFADRVRNDGAEVLIGRSSRSGGAAYGPLRDAIEGEIGAPEALPFADGWTEAEDAEMYQAQLAALYYQVTTELADHARERPTVLVIEDLQWADAATIDVLAHVASEVTEAPLLIVATYRPSGVEDEDPLGSRLAERSAIDRAFELPLDPFDRDRTAELVEAEVQRRGVPAAFVDAIYEGTGGNPLFVVETIAQLLERGTLDPRVDRYPEAVEEIEIPDVVETLVDRRFAKLDDATRDVLDVAAAFSNPIPVDAILAISSRPEPAVRERIELLVDGGIWVRDGDDRVRFRSEVLRSTALSSIDGDRRRSLHEAVAEYLADDETSPPAVVASQYDRAGEPERALEYYRQAAADATEVYAHDVAVEHYERALSLARDLDRDEAVLDILESLGDIHATRGEYDEADKQFRYVRERADDPERIRRSYRYQAEMAFQSSKNDETERYAREGLAVGGDEITPEVCRLTDYLGSAHFGRGEYEEAVEYHEQLRERAEEIGCTLSLGRAHQNLGACYGNLGEPERAVELNERGVELLEAAGDERELASALNDLAIAYDGVGDYEAAVDTLERCDELAERTGNLGANVLAKSNRAGFAQRRGEWDTSRELWAEVREIAERIDDRVAHASAIWSGGKIEFEIGHLDDAIDEFEDALAIARDAERTSRVLHFEWGLGRAHFFAGSFDRAEDHLDRATDLATEHGYERLVGASKSVRGSVERERGATERALELHREALDLAADNNEFICCLRGNRLARTLVRAGETEEALDLARETRERIPDGKLVLAAKIDATYGAAQLAAGDRESARETLEATVERARDLSNQAVVVALRELGRLEGQEGNETAARERLEEGREIAAGAGLRVFLPHFDELLAEIDGETPAESEERTA